VVWVVGIPLLMVALMVWSRRVMRSPSQGLETLQGAIAKEIAAFSKDYKPEYFWWNLVEILRKLLVIAGLRVVSSDSPIYQANILIVVFLVSCFMQHMIEPYVSRDGVSNTLNTMDYSSLVALVLILCSGVMMHSEYEKEADGSSIVHITITTVMAVTTLSAIVLSYLYVFFKYPYRRSAVGDVHGAAVGPVDARERVRGVGAVSPSSGTPAPAVAVPVGEMRAEESPEASAGGGDNEGRGGREKKGGAHPSVNF
jgi:hypothetical protein